jgi:hypothetical protein
MNNKIGGPPKGQPWVWLTLELIESDAWRSIGINTVKLINFLMREHLRHGGAENGKLKAPQHQLEACGIGARYVARAIAQADEVGLVDCRRNGMRAASTYALTWLPSYDGRGPSNRWRSYRNPDLKPLPAPKSKNLPLKGKVGLPLKGKVDHPTCPSKGRQIPSKICPSKGRTFLDSSYRARGVSTDLDGEEREIGHAPCISTDVVAGHSGRQAASRAIGRVDDDAERGRHEPHTADTPQEAQDHHKCWASVV